jgi:hypothetical protein
MGSLTSLKARVADLLNEEPKAINSRSLFLTKAGLLTSEGRGKTAIARPSDATNLLLAFLGGGRATDVVNTVVSLRGASGMHLAKNSLEKVPEFESLGIPPIDCFQSLPISTYVRRRRRHHYLQLGDVLDAIFTDLSHRTELPTFTDVDEPIEDFDLMIRRWKGGWSAEIYVSDGEAREWTFTFHAENPAQKPKTSDEFLKGGDRKITDSVELRTLWHLSNELRST